MFCKKCGKEQKDGQKFCPRCGEPFLDENGKPYLKGLRKDMQEAKAKMASKVDDLTQRGKKLVDENGKPILRGIGKGVLDTKDDVISMTKELSQQSKQFLEEKVRPQLNNKIKEIKKYDWGKKKTKIINKVQDFFSDVNKLRGVTIFIAIIAVLWFFGFNHGFSASWIWWTIAIVLIVAAFNKVDKSEANALRTARWALVLTIVLSLVLITHNSTKSSPFGNFDIDSINVNASNDRDMVILDEMTRIRGEINSILPQVEALYNAHQQHMAQGLPYATTPAWGRWQDLNTKIDNLWNKYIMLAQKLSGNNDDVIEEARESKRTMDNAFNDMFGPHY